MSTHNTVRQYILPIICHSSRVGIYPLKQSVVLCFVLERGFKPSSYYIRDPELMWSCHQLHAAVLFQVLYSYMELCKVGLNVN